MVGGLGTGFDGYSDIITFGFDEGIKLAFSYTHFEGCNDGKVKCTVIGLWYGINGGGGWFISNSLFTGLM